MKSSMADLRDERGNPIELTDQYGKPVQLTDEFGNPMHLTGVATTHTAGVGAALRHESQPAPVVQQKEQLGRESQPAPVVQQKEQLRRESQPAPVVQQQQQLRRSGSPSSSSSSEDDEQGGRRKKKGLKERIKETFGGGVHKDKDEGAHNVPATTTSSQSKMSTTAMPLPGHQATEHEKKGFMEKIKQKLPGHHHDISTD